MIALSEHFTLTELIRSDYAIRHGIDNVPPADLFDNLVELAAGLERIRRILGHPIHVNSGYRCPKLNSAIGGSKTSAHMLGLAADILCPDFGDPRDVAIELAIHADEIGYDQVILEYPPNGWVHVGFSEVGKEPRGQVLTFDNGKYSQGVI